MTRKITRAIANILSGKQKVVHLGNINAKRDWGYAPEYVETMVGILQHDKPGDFVIGTGETHSVKEFVEQAFSYVGLSSEECVRIDPRYFRPTEAEELVADSRKAQRELGWKPKIKFEELVKIMVDADMRKAGLAPIGEGDRILQRAFQAKWWKTD